MLARNAYGTSLGENSYGMPGQPKSGQPKQQQSPSMDLSAYAPGRAQPIQPPSQGTPFQAYSQPSSSSTYSTNADGVNRTYTTNAYQGNDAGNYGNAPSPQRPQPFSQGATGIGGQQFSDPSQAFTQRDAMIQRINEARAPMFAGAGTYLGDGAPPPTWGQKPPMDFNTMMGQANDMVSSGWQNPFAAPQSSRPDSYYDANGNWTLADSPDPRLGQRQGIRHWTDYPAYQQPQFQEQAIPQVQGTVDYGAAGNNGYVPDERAVQAQPAPASRPVLLHPSSNPASQPSPGSEQWWSQQNARASRAPSPARYPYSPQAYGRSPSRLNPQQQHQRAMAGAGLPRQSPRPPSGMQQNQRWLNSLTTDNRSIYQMMQRR